MIGRTPAAATTQLVENFQRTLSTVTPANSLYTRGLDVVGLYALIYAGGQRIPLRRAAEPLQLSLLHHFTIERVERHLWRLHTAFYAYTLLDAEDRELFSFHWHPDVPDMPYPHLHVGHGVGELRPAFSRLHVPTGRVALEDVVRFAIRDLGVEARRDDWHDALAASREAFAAARTWA